MNVKEVSCAWFPVRLVFEFISIGQAWQVQRGAWCFLLPQTSKSEFVEAFKNINLGIFRKDKKKTIFKKWKWGSFSADQLQSAGSLTSCVSQRQLIFFFIFVFLSDNNFSCNYKNFGNCNREALLLCRATGSSRERQFWGCNRTDRACLAPSLETKMEEFFQINRFPGPFLRQIRRIKNYFQEVPWFFVFPFFNLSWIWQMANW